MKFAKDLHYSLKEIGGGCFGTLCLAMTMLIFV